MDIKQIDFDRVERVAAEYSLTLPIEQTRQWAVYQATVADRKSVV